MLCLSVWSQLGIRGHTDASMVDRDLSCHNFIKAAPEVFSLVGYVRLAPPPKTIIFGEAIITAKYCEMHAAAALVLRTTTRVVTKSTVPVLD